MRKVEKSAGRNKKSFWYLGKLSTSGMFILSITSIVLITSVALLLSFVRIYRSTLEQNTMTSSEQAVERVKNTVVAYIDDMSTIMENIEQIIGGEERNLNEYLRKLLEIRSDVVAVTAYDQNGTLLSYWANGQQLKSNYTKNLSYIRETGNIKNDIGTFHISRPHVESILVNYYPWVVTISQYMKDSTGEMLRVAMDIRFNNIAEYVDGVGIGQHGYCYIAAENSDIVYHPQQQLLYAGLKTEDTQTGKEGTYYRDDVICTVRALDNCDWKIVGVSYVDEMITDRMRSVSGMLVLAFSAVLLFAFLLGSFLSRLFSEPAQQLADAMGEFEKNTDNFSMEPIIGTSEMHALSDSFEHMVGRIQELMEQVRREEVSLRKTELRALQAQINPHFLYNTLDAIAWLCEEGRNEDAVEMVNSLAKLFRISISKGHELIPIQKEVEHAECYLKIQKYRYKNQFTYRFDVDEECLDYYCNKITLQPIIENAICHGLDLMVDEGHIDIGIHQQEGDILFTVRDNGVGMTKEKCEEILHQESGDQIGIGIKNVNDRVKIYFGSQYGIKIDSELDEGTCVTIRMPKITENNYEEQK